MIGINTPTAQLAAYVSYAFEQQCEGLSVTVTFESY
jgi:hypothetical protein